MEFTLTNGVHLKSGKRLGPETGDAAEFKTYEEFRSALHAQLRHLLRRFSISQNVLEELHYQYLPNPVASLFTPGCLESGRDLTHGGAEFNTGPGMNGNGVGDFVDSVAAVKKIVFEEQRFGMAELVAAVKADFRGYEGIRRILEEDAPKWGNNDDEADAVDGAPDRQPPVKLKNNWFARPFEMFITMYGLPGYGDLDPTGFVAVTYALLFGIMFGDVGQGVLLGLIAYFVMWKKMHMELGRVVARCSVFSVIFGFLYGSVFGYEHVLDPMFHALGFAEKPLEVLAPEGISNILIASVVAGVLIIVSAIVTGIISNLRKHIIAKTIFSVNGVSGLVFYVSLIALLLPMLGMELTFVGSVPYLILCIAVPFFLMYFAEPLSALCAGEKPEGSVGDILLNGFFEMFDTVLSFASNTMSFLRVGGFVLVHAGMMTVVFTLANMTGGVFYVLIVAVGNVFVMALEALFVGIQVLRLEFYEIFSRFFNANGVPFAPLRISLDPAADKAE